MTSPSPQSPKKSQDSILFMSSESALVSESKYHLVFILQWKILLTFLFSEKNVWIDFVLRETSLEVEGSWAT
jgi:hypothetical protein